jgi:hypothetical protein
MEWRYRTSRTAGMTDAACSRALAEGVQLHAGIMEALVPWAAKLGVSPPAPL